MSFRFGRSIALRSIALLALVATAMGSSGCRGARGGDTADPASSAPRSLPPLVLRDDTANLMLTWIDAKGDAHVASKLDEVPAEGRDQVRVVLSDHEEGTGDVFYVANLTTKNADGSYPVTTTSRRDWDAVIEQRREAALSAARAAAAPATPDPSSPAPGEPSPANPAAPPPARSPSAGHGPKSPIVNFTVVVYGASWCEACHEAMNYLQGRRIPAIEKDIEADRQALEEMQTKLARAGMHGGSIPVIDVNGRILIGFEPHQLDAAIVAGTGGKAL